MQEWIGWGFSVKRGKGIAGISEVFGVLFFRGGIALGYRYSRSGEPGYVGFGYSWASGVSDINGMSMGFGTTWLYLNHTVYRAYGFQLRCLSE